MDRIWNRCMAAGTLALALGVGGSFATSDAPSCSRVSARAREPLVSYFWSAPHAPQSVASRLTRTLLHAFFS